MTRTKTDSRGMKVMKTVRDVVSIFDSWTPAAGMIYSATMMERPVRMTEDDFEEHLAKDGNARFITFLRHGGKDKVVFNK